jgi:hypothetical protein
MASPYINIATPPIQSSNVTATSSATTTSGTDAVMTGMTITPIQGTYIAIFTGVIQQNTAGDSITISFYVGGTQDATSIMDFAPFCGGTLTSGSASCCAVTQGVYTVNGSQAIAIEWHVSGGTGTVFQRKLTVVKIG